MSHRNKYSEERSKEKKLDQDLDSYYRDSEGKKNLAGKSFDKKTDGKGP